MAKSTKELKAALKHPPSYFIKERMAKLGLDEAKLAYETGINPGHIKEILRDKRLLNFGEAAVLSYILGGTMPYWFNISKDYHDLLKATKEK